MVEFDGEILKSALPRAATSRGTNSQLERLLLVIERTEQVQRVRVNEWLETWSREVAASARHGGCPQKTMISRSFGGFVPSRRGW